jgi:hypothetical protein
MSKKESRARSTRSSVDIDWMGDRKTEKKENEGSVAIGKVTD